MDLQEELGQSEEFNKTENKTMINNCCRPKGYKMLEPYEGKLSRTVLRRVGASNRSFLFGLVPERALLYSAKAN